MRGCHFAAISLVSFIVSLCANLPAHADDGGWNVWKLQDNTWREMDSPSEKLTTTGLSTGTYLIDFPQNPAGFAFTVVCIGRQQTAAVTFYEVVERDGVVSKGGNPVSTDEKYTVKASTQADGGGGFVYPSVTVFQAKWVAGRRLILETDLSNTYLYILKLRAPD